MAVRFLVISSDQPAGKPWVDCESVPGSVNLPDRLWDKEPNKSRILHIEVVDGTIPDDYPNHVCEAEAPAIEAIAKLDEANLGGRCMFHNALARVFQMGMEAQRELDSKAQGQHNHDVTNGSR